MERTILCLSCGNRRSQPNNYVCKGCEKDLWERHGIPPKQ